MGNTMPESKGGLDLDQMKPDPEPDDMIKSYRYLRVALPVLILFLVAAVITEFFSTPGGHCFRTSISGYYYTPARAVLTGSLIAVGVCLIALKGRAEAEDALLNVAGMFAFVVALVPPPPPTTQSIRAGLECWSVQVDYANTRENIANNLTALLVVGTVSLAVVPILNKVTAKRKWPSSWKVGYGFAWFVLLLTVVWLIIVRQSRDDHSFFLLTRIAHYGAAIGLFACIVWVVRLNSTRYNQFVARTTPVSPRWNQYHRIFWAMVGSGCLEAVLGLVPWRRSGLSLEWQHWLLGVETTEVVLFATFWALQTIESWDRRERISPASCRPSSGEQIAG